MRTKGTNIGVIQLLRIAAILWLMYMAVLAAINFRLAFPPHAVQISGDKLATLVGQPAGAELRQILRARLQELPFQYMYFLTNAVTALVMLGSTMWPWLQNRLGRAYLPLMIVFMSVPPIVSKYVTGSIFLLGPLVLSGGMVVFLMALVLTAWQYRWRHVVIFCLGTAALDVAMAGLFGPISFVAIFAGLLSLIQTAGFLVVGYFINALMNQLRVEQESRELANVQLRHQVSTLEHLTVSRERNRMARELHDTLAHTLSALSVQLETVKAYWNVDSATAQGALDKSLDATRSGLQETRRALKSLRASPLEDLGLGLALRRLAESAATRANLALDLRLPEENLALAPDAEQCIYRVAQEAVANVTHHASARQLTLHLTRDTNTLTLRVQDDGRGFDVSSREDAEHFGLSGMRERAEMAGGKLAVSSGLGQGTTIELTLESEE